MKARRRRPSRAATALPRRLTAATLWRQYGAIMEPQEVGMPSLSIKNVPEEVIARLRERAERNHRSLQRELLALVC
jgi:hypothetical protein